MYFIEGDNDVADAAIVVWLLMRIYMTSEKNLDMAHNFYSVFVTLETNCD